MHPQNIHKQGYNFTELVKSLPALAQFVIVSPTGKASIDFADPKAVKVLNAALLKHYYRIDFWDIPPAYLCPPVPGRADYIHALADLLELSMGNTKDTKIVGLDIGTGANLIYPIIGSQSYGWHFVGSEVDKVAVQSAKVIQSSNPVLSKTIRIRHQSNANKIFEGVVKSTDHFTFSMCNPPFHLSQKAALAGSIKKTANLNRHKQKRAAHHKVNAVAAKKQPILNFAGQGNELWCQGGEVSFIQRMIAESSEYRQQITWFTSLVSKKDSLKPLYRKLKEIDATEVQTISMTQGNKASRFIAWRF